MGASQGAGALDPRFDRAPCFGDKITQDSKTTDPPRWDRSCQQPGGKKAEPPRSYTTFPVAGMNAARWESG